MLVSGSVYHLGGLHGKFQTAISGFSGLVGLHMFTYHFWCPKISQNNMNTFQNSRTAIPEGRTTRHDFSKTRLHGGKAEPA